MATGLTNTSKTVGGAVASAVFGVVLAGGTGAIVAGGTGTHSDFGGYVAVWVVCAVAALVAAVLLFVVPKDAFADADPEPVVTPSA